MAAFRFLRRLASRLSGWGRSETASAARKVELTWTEPLEGLKALLAGEGAIPCPDSEARVARLEERYSISIPTDFRRYLLHIAPLKDAMDGEITDWWSLDRICNIPGDYRQEVSEPIASEAAAYLFFADYMMWCWAWAVCCSDGPNRGRVALIGADPDGFVADSFTGFVERYLRNPVDMAHTFPPQWHEAGSALH
jgi:hypothetical protein